MIKTPWSDKEESILQGLIAIGGFLNSATDKIAEDQEGKALHKITKALEITEKLIKSIRGF